MEDPCFTLTGILVSITPRKLVRSFLVQTTQSWGKSLCDFFWLILCKSSCERCQSGKERGKYWWFFPLKDEKKEPK